MIYYMIIYSELLVLNILIRLLVCPSWLNKKIMIRCLCGLLQTEHSILYWLPSGEGEREREGLGASPDLVGTGMLLFSFFLSPWQGFSSFLFSLSLLPPPPHSRVFPLLGRGGGGGGGGSRTIKSLLLYIVHQ